MQRQIIAVIIVCFVLVTCVMLTEGRTEGDYYSPSATTEEEKPPEILPKCPEYGFVMEWESCLDCHVVPSMKLKKEKPFEEYDKNTPAHTSVRTNCDGEVELYYVLRTISDYDIDELFQYATYHNFHKVVVEIHSPGGSLFNAQRIVSIFDAWREQDKRNVIETRINGMAFSAGFNIFVGGSIGYRLLNSHAVLMWHQLKSFEMYSIDTPASANDKARILNFLQRNVNEYIAGRTKGKTSVEDLEKLIIKDELWISGEQAFEMGFADGFLDNE